MLSGITCCKFSESHPNLLACGTYDGVIAIYDIRKKDDKPVQENKEMQGKHSDPIWEVHWVGKGGKSTDKGEGLVSISSDGIEAEINFFRKNRRVVHEKRPGIH